MQGVNHIAGGLAFTGIFASFLDINVFEKPEFIAVTVISSLLADIDHTKSIIGKSFYPLAKWIDRKYGHRTVTHSLFFYLILTAAFGCLELYFLGSKTLTILFALGYGSHLLFDMCTRAGIPLFMPFTRSRCVLPGNPNMRLSSKSTAAEAIIFFVFVGLLFTTAPLMANGFWTSYNKAFATFSHLQREFNGSKDLLYISTEQGARGHVVAATDKGAVIYAGGTFRHIGEPQHTLKAFMHTKQPRATQRIEFENISADSLRQLLKQPLLYIKSISNLPIRYKVAGEQFEKTAMDLEYITGFQFQEVIPDSSQTTAAIATLNADIGAKQSELSAFYISESQNRKKLADLQKVYSELSEYEQGKAIDEIASLRAELEASEAPNVLPYIEQAEIQLNQLRASIAAQKHSFTGVCEIWKQ